MKAFPSIIFILTIIIIVLIYLIRMKKLKYKWPIIILRIGLPNVSLGLFGPIFLCYSTLLDCQDGHTYISNELQQKNHKYENTLYDSRSVQRIFVK